MVSNWSELRHRINRDDGKLIQVGNRPIVWVEGVGFLLFIVGVVLKQVHAEIGLNEAWAVSTGALGMLLCIFGNTGKDNDPGA
jgi:hypothetical protein